MMRSKISMGLVTLLLGSANAALSAQHARQTVVLIVSDGLRWQEVFTGADSSLLNSDHGGIWEDSAQLRRAFWRDSVAARRRALLPFFWTVVAQRGQIFGDQSRGSVARVANGLGFSYPGYNEMLTGQPDPRINSNEYGPNPNITVLEWLNGLPAYRGKVAVFATWATFKDIFDQPRSHLPIVAGWELPPPRRGTARDALLDTLFRTTTRLDDTDLYNAFLQLPLLDFIRTGTGRVLFVGYGETDNWAHQGRYDLVLESARHFDDFVRELWETMQAMPQYRGRTTFIITTDHGRGSGLENWKHHGKEYPGSDDIWIAVMGPNTEALGLREGVPTVLQAQIAATVAALLGEDYVSFSRFAAPPLPGVVKPPGR